MTDPVELELAQCLANGRDPWVPFTDPAQIDAALHRLGVTPEPAPRESWLELAWQWLTRKAASR